MTAQHSSNNDDAGGDGVRGTIAARARWLPLGLTARRYMIGMTFGPHRA